VNGAQRQPRLEATDALYPTKMTPVAIHLGLREWSLCFHSHCGMGAPNSASGCNLRLYELCDVFAT